MAAGTLLCGAAASAWAQRAPLTPEELYDRLAPSVWVVEARVSKDAGSQGSAVVIAPGILITNCHVIEKANTITVTHGRVTHAAQLQYHDPSRDLCQLRAPGMVAPSVPLAPSSALHPGQKVYAIGNPRGLELTISDGLVSGLRRDAAGQLQIVQISVPISPGSSGGGLFDGYGRLVGITTAGLRESQNLNFALPSEWVMELPRRLGGAVVATMQSGGVPVAVAPAPAKSEPAGQPAPPAPAPVATAPAPVATPPAAVVPAPAANEPSTAAAGRVFEYELRDRTTSSVRTVTYRLDRTDGIKRIYNQGSRVEDEQGRVLLNTAPIGGDYDVAMPPGGWVPADAKPGSTWKTNYRSGGAGQLVAMDLQARVLGEETLQLKGEELHVLRVQFTGYTQRGSSANTSPPGRYQATAWYSPQLQRVVRFEAKTRGGVSTASFWIDEQLQLVDIRSD